MKPRTFWESDLRALGVKWECCGSCHDDEDWGYSRMVGGLDPRTGDELHGCCGVPDITDEQWGEMRKRAA